MKTNSWKLICVLGLMGGLLSCTKNEPTTDRQIPRDDLKTVTQSFFKLDSTGAIIGKPAIGEARNAETPSVYYACATTIKEAKTEFLVFIADEIELEESGNDVTIVLRDSTKAIQGKIFFKEVADHANGHLAEVTFSDEIQFPNFTKVIYTEDNSWGSSQSRYKYMSVVRVQDGAHGNPTGLCIREYSPGTNGIIIVPMTSKANRKEAVWNCWQGTLKTYSEVCRNIGVDAVNAKLKSMDLNDLDHRYWANMKDHGAWEERYWVNLQTGSSGSYATGNTDKNFNFLGYWFDETGHCW